MSLLLDLVLTFMKIGVLSFGGGYAAISLVQHQVVDIKHWMSLSQYLDIVTIDELTPGPVAVNAATFVGIKLAGIPGAVAATLGVLIPSFIIALILVRLYYKYRNLSIMNGALTGLRSMVVALVASATLTIFITNIFGGTISLSSVDYISVCLFAISLFVLKKYQLNPLLVMLASGLIGAIIYSLI